MHHFGPWLFNFTDVILSIWKMNPVISISTSFLSLVLVGHAQLGSMQNTKSKENHTSLIHILFLKYTALLVGRSDFLFCAVSFSLFKTALPL